LPVRWAHADGSKVSLFHHTREMALDLCRIRWNEWRGCYRLPRDAGGGGRAMPCSSS